VGGGCCSNFICNADQACCLGFGCYARNGTKQCCPNVGIYEPSQSTCCAAPPAQGARASLCLAAEQCCYPRYKSPCMDPRNTTCCPSILWAPMSFQAPGVNVTCCGDMARDYACTPPTVCCPKLKGSLSTNQQQHDKNEQIPHRSRSVVREKRSDEMNEQKRRSYCADPATDFCCPYLDFFYEPPKNGYFQTSAGCPLGMSS
jgi:hypothetical protein